MDKCPKCGAKVYGKFCSNCGEKIPEDTVSESSGTKRMQMRCQNCNGELRFDSDKSILSCPFCGSTEIIVESDEVKLQRMQNEIETERLLAQERQQKRQYQLELEKAQKELDKKKAESEARSDRAESCLTAITLFVGAIVAIATIAPTNNVIAVKQLSARSLLASLSAFFLSSSFCAFSSSS